MKAVSLLLGTVLGLLATATAETAEIEIRNSLSELFEKGVAILDEERREEPQDGQSPWVTRELLFLFSTEQKRMDAFYEGLNYHRESPPLLKPPTPSSYWIPLYPDVAYLPEVESVSMEEDDTAKVRLLCVSYYDGKRQPDEFVTWILKPQDGRWKIDNVLNERGYDLRVHLERPRYMSDEGLYQPSGT